MPIGKVSALSGRKKSHIPLFKSSVVNKQYKKYHAVDLMKNSHFSIWNKCLIFLIDNIRPVMNKHPKLEKYFFKITEYSLAKEKELKSGIDTKV